jgi:ring-1,2-phenylacetyl-CoA epoxidase subunit PaaE
MMDTFKLKVIKIIRETKGAATIFLEPADGSSITYEAGQFLTFIFYHHHKELRRSYSISSAPGIDPVISITVKRIPNGEISRHLLNHLQTGDILISLPAAGRFTITTGSTLQRQFFFITAGSGIAPVFALIKKILNEEPLSEIILISQNHNEEQIIFKNELHELTKKYPLHFKWISLLSKPAEKKHLPERLTNSLLEKLITHNVSFNSATLFYLCGPPAFMRMAQFTLKLIGFTGEQIKKENFTVEYIPPAPIINDTKPKQVTVHYKNETFYIEAAYPLNILQAALNNNIQLPYSCRGGRCSTCVARCLKGIVKMSINEVLTEKDLNEGLILTCVGYAETDVEIEV